ncbi:MAG: 50S ribosomal protein L33 [Candidatus Portnoybacteria bacterium RIFCSPLOWO2_12_FULL_39_9]|uniref:Large ribosomal subunit protein bL33 n=1 Tax=Candidatus Portnoybacteria bacterium RIFCSPHIGHO2_12_FULL_38_9 TaxID=1801997 RepID=A0A1G2FDW6_9BACT|nr:MAG: 50S ribosomal protein L33 [Candidatus Portnoybacteria bacterium RBG_13_40_8]OGZ36249.1 MAG: 50S ribosomal protein L33 [Candidatus Portnoybacteria bacterium RIFCSPHIGHO2_12_FULL_38_9]OGZ36938.1 MAG: 50S ribosomal protein L33 [Candidatus Portnoybacteria bacterium RIFCSPHIGHO2_02_FULL_39_12]OGZ37987.1 MAG: 50S ribosomal protein L33 [Candidatus Portnoybacteria bacterium RIFCSPLOWO2_01_FULL_38_39]OGZ40067.1 MAG: 50S ribosomal protein L33 [Candidatus Portnoybacteria bacterium RIFCSPLOWO2_12_F
MPQENLIKLQCGQCKRINYWSRKNRKKAQSMPAGKSGKLELKKFCKWCRKHTTHKEMKK